MGSKVDTPFIVFLNCPEETMLQRLTKRGETSGRSDDNIESIKKRFKTYNEETMPVIKFFEKDERVIEVNAEGSIEEIYAKLKEGMDKRGMN
jgi:UMP-CMP kinase